jgi:DUF3006 family protein
MAKNSNAKRPDRAAAVERGAGGRHTWAIDRLEERTASVEHDGDRVFHVPRALIPAHAREGDVLDVRITIGAGGELVTTSVRVDPAATQAANDASTLQVKRVSRGDDPGGDIVL